jgi:hypothetical protein
MIGRYYVIFSTRRFINPLKEIPWNVIRNISNRQSASNTKIYFKSIITFAILYSYISETH